MNITIRNVNLIWLKHAALNILPATLALFISWIVFNKTIFLTAATICFLIFLIISIPAFIQTD